MNDIKTQWLKWVSEIQAISQSGMVYAHNEFDKERYLRLEEISAEIAAVCSDYSFSELHNLFTVEKGYATPKLDVRAFITQGNTVLLVKEQSDGLWSLPGGWADVNESPSEAVVREVIEETGYKVRAMKLLALWDKLKHDHPLQWPHSYKCFFHCELLAGEAKENLEISAIDFFDLDHLPELSTHRVTQKQIIRLHDLVLNDSMTHFD